MKEIQKPKGTKLSEAKKREERLAQTLRENLRKRKAAARKTAVKDKS